MSDNIYKYTSAIVLAGGAGSRFNGKKQFCIIGNKQMWEYPYDKVRRLLGKNRVIVVGRDVKGGMSRTGSVINGMNAVPVDTKRIIILEAARPLVTIEQIKILIEDNSPSTTFVRPLVNTVIYRNATYINRDDLYDLLTPQAFDYKMLREALNSGKYNDMTDETRIMYEYYNIKPNFIETTDNLFKVTYPQDIFFVKTILEKKDLEAKI